MFRSLIAGAAALVIAIGSAPERAKADDGDIAAGIIFGAIVGGVLAGALDNDRKDYRVEKRFKPRYGYGHRHYKKHGYVKRYDRFGRPFFVDRRDLRRAEERRIERRIDRRAERRAEERRLERRAERRAERLAEERRLERRVERPLNREDQLAARERFFRGIGGDTALNLR
ncbi:MAG: hypothetical protein AAFN79_08655 [Pseudomonadota bacterium]